jgi:hypothetical protein
LFSFPGVASKSMEREKREERRRKGKKMAIGATPSTRQHAFCPTMPWKDVNGVRMEPCASLECNKATSYAVFALHALYIFFLI